MKSLFLISRLPFDYRNPFGYLVAIGIQLMLLWYSDMIGGCVIALACGSYLCAIDGSKCIKESLFSITRNANNRNDLMEQLIEYIQFHSHMKQLSTHPCGKKLLTD